MHKRSCKLIKHVLENSNISNFIKKIEIDDSVSHGNMFYKMIVEPKKSHTHLTHNIKYMAYNLIACCEQEYIDTSIKHDKLYIQ